MTEQERFKLAYTKEDWWAVRDGEITLWKEEVIHLLNELHEENDRLKKENTLLKAKNEQLQNKKNYLHNKPQVWFTQSAKLTDKEVGKVAEAIEQDLKERRIKE